MISKAIVQSFFILTLLLSQALAGEMDYAAVYQKTSGSVVLVAAYADNGNSKQGSGFIISADGLVVTNSHVIYFDEAKKAALRIVIYLKPDKISGRAGDDLTLRYDARLLDYSNELDLALLKISDPPKNLKVLDFADPEKTVVGLATAAIGHPVGGTRWSLTTGRISGNISDFNNVAGRNMIQMENSLNPGNSGGPLINAEGRVIGVNTATMRKGPDGFVLEGINFAISGDTAMNWLEKEKVQINPVKRNNKQDQPVMVKEKKAFSSSEKMGDNLLDRQRPEKKPVKNPVKKLRKQDNKKEKKPEVKPGKVFTPNDIEKMMDKMVDDMEEEFKQHKKKYDF